MFWMDEKISIYVLYVIKLSTKKQILWLFFLQLYSKISANKLRFMILTIIMQNKNNGWSKGKKILTAYMSLSAKTNTPAQEVTEKVAHPRDKKQTGWKQLQLMPKQ